MRAWGGIAGLQYALPATWQPWHQAGLNLTRFAQVGGAAAGLGARAEQGWGARLLFWIGPACSTCTRASYPWSAGLVLCAGAVGHAGAAQGPAVGRV